MISQEKLLFGAISLRTRINSTIKKLNSIYVISVPPDVNNTNPDDKLEFVLFFSNEYFGIKVDLNGKKKNQPGV